MKGVTMQNRYPIILTLLLMFLLFVIIGCGETSTISTEMDTSGVEQHSEETADREGEEAEKAVAESEGQIQPAEGSPSNVIYRCIAAVESGDLAGALSCFHDPIREDYERYGDAYYDFPGMLANFDVSFSDVSLSEPRETSDGVEVAVEGGTVTVNGLGMNKTMDLTGSGETEIIGLGQNADGTWGICIASDGLDSVAEELLDEMWSLLP